MEVIEELEEPLVLFVEPVDVRAIPLSVPLDECQSSPLQVGGLRTVYKSFRGFPRRNKYILFDTRVVETAALSGTVPAKNPSFHTIQNVQTAIWRFEPVDTDARKRVPQMVADRDMATHFPTQRAGEKAVTTPSGARRLTRTEISVRPGLFRIPLRRRERPLKRV
jgi:hypothetical protein